MRWATLIELDLSCTADNEIGFHHLGGGVYATWPASAQAPRLRSPHPYNPIRIATGGGAAAARSHPLTAIPFLGHLVRVDQGREKEKAAACVGKRTGLCSRSEAGSQSRLRGGSGRSTSWPGGGVPAAVASLGRGPADRAGIESSRVKHRLSGAVAPRWPRQPRAVGVPTRRRGRPTYPLLPPPPCSRGGVGPPRTAARGLAAALPTAATGASLLPFCRCRPSLAHLAPPHHPRSPSSSLPLCPFLSPLPP